LDRNVDGIWSVEEARADYNNLGCSLGVPLDDVFQSACRGLIRDASEAAVNGKTALDVPQEVRERRAIPKAYFEWWRGLVALCVHTDVTLCGEMMKKNLFDGAMDPKNNGARGGVIDLDSAMGYCQRLVASGGICDTALPGTYVMYRSRLEEKCGSPIYHAGSRYTNPHDEHDMLTTTSVSYKNLALYENTHSPQFLFFLILLMIVWGINLVDELKDIIDLWDFIAHFPVENEMPFLSRKARRKLTEGAKTVGKDIHGKFAGGFQSIRDKVKNAGIFAKAGEQERQGERQEESSSTATPAAAAAVDAHLEDELDEAEAEEMTITATLVQSVTIKSIARPHQLTCIITAAVRSIVWFYLAWVGCEFLLMNRTYIDLMLNGLAIFFVFELDEFLFVLLCPASTKDQLDGVRPLRFDSAIPRRGPFKALAQKYVWGLVFIPILTTVYVLRHDATQTSQVVAALRCACLHDGDHCQAGGLFNKDFWATYWDKTVQLG
jgi:hypothetical protein